MTIDELKQRLPDEWPEDLEGQIREGLLASNVTLVVLDDDPTGTQTVHDVPVLTEWDECSLESLFKEEPPLVFLLTNSRSLSESATAELHEEIAKQLSNVSLRTGRLLEVISRSDSTLRGHYPLETDALIANWHEPIDLTILIPFFLEGGRFTIDGQHYVKEGSELLPAHETPFAQDSVFSFKESYLPRYVEEKTEGRILAKQVVIISLETIRKKGIEGVIHLIAEAPNGGVCVVDSVSDRDVQVVATAVSVFRERGRNIMVRSAASYVRARAGLPKRELLSSDDFRSEGKGGLLVVGSHVPKTTAQLSCLLARYPKLIQVELSVASILEDSIQAVEEAADKVNKALIEDEEVVLFTSRDLIKGKSDQENIDISASVSTCLVNIVKSLEQRPRFLIAKGGITSSDVVTKGLNTKKARVAGSILPGVPVWCLGKESSFPGLFYVIFPGNVGDDESLAEALAKISKS